jgi:hypothetical protein
LPRQIALPLTPEPLRAECDDERRQRANWGQLRWPATRLRSDIGLSGKNARMFNPKKPNAAVSPEARFRADRLQRIVGHPPKARACLTSVLMALLGDMTSIPTPSARFVATPGRRLREQEVRFKRNGMQTSAGATPNSEEDFCAPVLIEAADALAGTKNVLEHTF